MARRRKGTASPTTADGKRDYVRIAIDYANRAIADRKGRRHGKLIRLAAKRFLNDLKRARRKRRPPFIFDEWHANDACDFIEKLPHVEGKWDTPNIVMHPAHVLFVVQLFGFRQTEAIHIEGWGDFRPRRFTSALFAVGRKNAKSTLAASILLYCECCEPEEGAQVISAATTFPQASIIFNVAKRMVQKTPDLREAFGLQVWSKSISRMEAGASFKPIHAKASTQDGLNPSHVGLDEIHAHKTSDLLNVLTSAAGGRANPLWLYTTTEGYPNPGPWSELRLFAHQLLEGVFGNDADHFLAVFFAVDEDDEDFDEDAWHKANPLLEVNPHLLTAIRKEAVEAKRMPSKMAEFRIKRLNRQASAAKALIDLRKWQKCNGPVNLGELERVPCWGGLDLASTTDIAALRLVWKLNGMLLTWGRRWVPESAVRHRTERGTVPYAGWVEAGHLIQTEGDVTDYGVIEADVLSCLERFNVQQIAYDPWNASDLVNRLTAANAPMIQFIQGPKSYHPAIQALERAYLVGKLAHGGDPVLQWCASNLVPRYDANLNMAPDKKRSADKIDDIVALLMAVGIATAADPDDDEDFMHGIRNPIIV